METKIKVPASLREDAIKHGAKFVDNSTEFDQLFENAASGYWIVPENVSPENKSYLLEHFFAEDLSENDILWKKAIEGGHTLDVLSCFNKNPLPGAEVLLKMFDLFRKVNEARRTGKTELSKEFPVNYDTLCEYSKEFEENWGLEKVSEMLEKTGITSIVDVFDVIESSNVSKTEKSFLKYFFS